MPDYLLEPVLTDGERAMIILSMARAAYTTWTELGGVKPEWDLLSEDDKRRWGKAVRSSFRVMLSLMAELQLDEDDGKVTVRKSA
jgi:hypothetical protein